LAVIAITALSLTSRMGTKDNKDFQANLMD
jgi:hypothetical protein